MSDIGFSGVHADAPEAEFGDYVALLKPRVMSLVVFTAAVGLLVAPVPVHPMVAFASILFIAVGGGASGALNMWWDADIDARDAAHPPRPIPAGRVAADEALALGWRCRASRWSCWRWPRTWWRRACWPSRSSSTRSSTRCG